MKISFKNKVVLVTGSSSGIGLSIAKKFVDLNAITLINGRNKQRLIKAKCEVNAKDFICGDVSDKEISNRIVNDIIKTYGKLDVLVCNVGNGKSVKPNNETIDEWKKSFQENFLSASTIIEASKEALIKSKGVITCVSSICGIETIINAPITYSISKSALNRYIKSISKPLGKLHVRINGVAPGNIIFEGSVWEKKLIEEKRLVKKMLSDEVALQRFGKPEEIANLVGFLSSQYSSFITGQIVVIDGGQIRN